ncbi:MAG: pentapeptide repeat-containing protein [Micromonosporaceae bacterium]
MSSMSRSGGLQFADLFQRAVEQLGSDRAPVRVGGLYGLEMLAQDHPRSRVAAVELICAYLRMPVAEAVVAGDDELQVRLAAQRILVAHLHPGDPGRFWPDTTLDLRGATLVELDLSGCRVDGLALFDRAEFFGATRLRGTVFGADAAFRSVNWYSHAWLERAVFRRHGLFDGSVFHGDAWFGETTFANRAAFTGTVFAGHAWFGGAHLHGPALLTGAAFRRSAGFRGATFHAGANLDGCTFAGPARVSRMEDRWNLCPPGWAVAVDPDNWCVGDLVPAHRPALAEAADSEPADTTDPLA